MPSRRAVPSQPRRPDQRHRLRRRGRLDVEADAVALLDRRDGALPRAEGQRRGDPEAGADGRDAREEDPGARRRPARTPRSATAARRDPVRVVGGQRRRSSSRRPAAGRIASAARRGRPRITPAAAAAVHQIAATIRVWVSLSALAEIAVIAPSAVALPAASSTVIRSRSQNCTPMRPRRRAPAGRRRNPPARGPWRRRSASHLGRGLVGGDRDAGGVRETPSPRRVLSAANASASVRSSPP